MPTAWVRMEKWHRLSGESLRVLFSLHAASRTGAIDYESPGQLALAAGLVPRKKRVLKSLAELEEAGFIEHQGDRIVLLHHVAVKSPGHRRAPTRRRVVASPEPGRHSVSVEKRGVAPSPFASARENEIPFGISEKELAGGPSERGPSRLSEREKKELDRRSDAISRAIGLTPRKRTDE